MPSTHPVNRFHVRRTLRLAQGIALLVPALAGAAAPPPAATPAPVENLTFHRTLSYILKVDGKAVPGGRFYLSDRGDAYLIIGPQLPGPVLVELQSKTVSTLASAPAEGPDGSLALPAGVARKPQGEYEIQDSSPAFTIDGKNVRLDYPSPLLKLQKVEAIYAYNPEYKRRATVYQPNPAALAQLAQIKEPVRLRIYFGTWCSICTNAMPRLMKVLDGLPKAALEVEYYGLPQERDADTEPARMKLQGLPTAIVYRQGQEVGRIEGKAWQQPEIALRAILFPGST
jgi:hypothetical protein